MLIRLIFVFSLFVAINASAEEKKGNSILLMFSEQEAGNEPYRVRMIIKDNLMRIDEGAPDNEFILFNKDEKVIYSVSSERESILVIKPVSSKSASPMKVELSVEKIEKMMFPRVSGKKPQAYKLNANNKTCNFVIAVPGLLDKALDMMRAYYTLLSYEQAEAQANIPKEMITDCDIANNIVAPARHLSYGFPVRESSKSGKQRSLVNFDEHYVADNKLFNLPEGYSRYSRQEIR